MTLRLPGAGGVTLAADAWGEPQGPAVMLLHGGGQTRGAWLGSAQRLAALGWYVIAPDLRGHGESDWSPDGRYAVELFAADVRAACGWLGRPVTLVGASLGGLSSLLAAGEAPRVNTPRVVLVDIAHRPEPLGVSRVISFMRANPEGFASLDEAARSVAGYLRHREAPEKTEGLKRNLRLRDGRWIWHWDPKMLEHFADGPTRATSVQRTLAAARAIEVPMLLVRGAMSDVLTAEIAEEFCAEVPGARWVDVAEAGHMVAGDRNDRFVEAIVPFLQDPRVRERAG